MTRCHCTPRSSDLTQCFPLWMFFFFFKLLLYALCIDFTLDYTLQMLCCSHNPHKSSLAACVLHTAEFKHHISICISCDTALALISPRVASRVPSRIDFLYCIYNGNHTRERRRKEQNRGSEGAKKRGRRAVKRWEESQSGEARRGRGMWSGVLLGMLVSHYSTAELVKWRDNSHLRPCAAAFTHKDGHAARLMPLCRLLPLCSHMFACCRA